MAGRAERTGRREARREAKARARSDAMERRRSEARTRGAGTEALDAIPRWLPPVLFAAVTLVLFREFIFSDRMLYGEDTLTLGYMARAFFADALRTTGFPLWNPVILGGTPFLESLAGGDSLYPPSVFLLLLLETYRALGWKLVLHVFLAGCFQYGWLRALEVSRSGALLGGLAFLLAPWMVTLVFPGHDGKIFVSALTPLLFWAAERVHRRGDLVSLAGLGATVAAVILTTHFQMAYFLFAAVGAYMVVRVFVGVPGEVAARRRAAFRFAAFVGFSLLGAGAAAIQLLPAVSYVTEHSRRTQTTVAADPEAAVAYSASWSLHPEEAVSLVVPEFVGNTRAGASWASGTYWGRNPFKLNHEYLGIVALLLAGLAFLGSGGRAPRWFLAGLGAVAALFALGANTPVWRLFYELVPGISLFRAPSMAIFLTGFSVATLAGVGFDRGMERARVGEGDRVIRRLGAFAALVTLAALLAASGALTAVWEVVFSGSMTELRSQTLARAEPHIVRGFLIAAGLSIGVLAIWWAAVRGAFTGRFTAALLCLLVGVDEFRIDAPFVQTLDFEAFAAPDPNHRFLMDRATFESPFRVFSMIQNGQDVAPGMHGLDLAGGHHPNDLARYRELIGMQGSGVPENLALFHPNVLRILNVRYILWPDGQYGPLEGADPLNQLTLPDGSVYSSVYPYPGLPRARVVGEAVVVAEEASLSTVLGEGETPYDPSVQAVLTEPPPIEPGGPGARGSATWVERSPNRLVLDVQATGPALLVVAENWMPGWQAMVDGAETPVLRADHALRAVALAGGVHRVELTYRPAELRVGLVVSLLCGLALLVAAGVGGFRSRSRRVPAEGPVLVGERGPE